MLLFVPECYTFLVGWLECYSFVVGCLECYSFVVGSLECYYVFKGDNLYISKFSQKHLGLLVFFFILPITKLGWGMYWIHCVCVSTCLCVCLSFCPCVHLSVCPPVSVSLCPLVCVSRHCQEGNL